MLECIFIIFCLSFRPESPPEEGMWKGISESGKVGFIHSANTKPYIEVKTGPSPAVKRTKVNRKGQWKRLTFHSLFNPFFNLCYPVILSFKLIMLVERIDL